MCAKFMHCVTYKFSEFINPYAFFNETKNRVLRNTCNGNNNSLERHNYVGKCMNRIVPPARVGKLSDVGTMHTAFRIFVKERILLLTTIILIIDERDIPIWF